MKEERLRYSMILLGYVVDISFSILLWKNNTRLISIYLALWFLSRLLIIAVKSSPLKVRGLPRFLVGLLPDVSGAVLTLGVIFILGNYKQTLLFFVILLLGEIFIAFFLFLFIFDNQFNFGRLKFTSVDEDSFSTFVKDMNMNFGVNLSLHYQQKTGIPQDDYNVHVDREQKVIMGEDFYKTTDLTSMQKLSILAHEAGHSKYDHSQKILFKRIWVVVAIIVVLSFGILNNRITVYCAFGLLLLSRPLFQVLSNAYSFKQEYEADRFCVVEAKCRKRDMISAIEFLVERSNISLKRMWWHKLFLTDHPSVQERALYIHSLNVE